MAIPEESIDKKQQEILEAGVQEILETELKAEEVAEAEVTMKVVQELLDIKAEAEVTKKVESSQTTHRMRLASGSRAAKRVHISTMKEASK